MKKNAGRGRGRGRARSNGAERGNWTGVVGGGGQQKISRRADGVVGMRGMANRQEASEKEKIISKARGTEGEGARQETEGKGGH